MTGKSNTKKEPKYYAEVRSIIASLDPQVKEDCLFNLKHANQAMRDYWSRDYPEENRAQREQDFYAHMDKVCDLLDIPYNEDSRAFVCHFTMNYWDDKEKFLFEFITHSGKTI